MDDWFPSIGAGRDLPPGTAEQVQEAGFAILSGPVAADRLPQLATAYDAAMASGHAADLKAGTTTTRLHNLATRGPEFDGLYIFPPLLQACAGVIGGPFKLSTLLGRTLRPHTPAQKLHIDIQRGSGDLPMLGFILMIDEFRPDNGATRFVPGSHTWPAGPDEAAQDLLADYAGQALACGPAGSLILFDGSVWHGHTANLTAEPRRSIQGYFVRRNARSGNGLPVSLNNETLARIGPLARYLLAV